MYDKLARGKLISRKDLKHGIEQTLSYSVTDEQVDRMMRMADLDDSGRIDFREFQVLFEDIEDDDISLESLAQYWLGFSEVVRDPAMIFQAAWRRLIALVGGEHSVRLPNEIMFLGGAPGAGKGTMTPYVMWERGITAKPIVMSQVLNSPSAQKIINEGGLVGDMEVFTMLLQELSQPERRHGTLVDGFPRTVVQVKLLQLLHQALSNASRRYDGTGFASEFRRPRFRMCILYVDEPTSIERQLSRGRQALENNKRVAETGEGELLEMRETDLSVKSARNRYRLFVEGTMAANEALKQSFPFNLINAAGTIEETRQVVMQELSYQSSLELQEETYDALKHLPTAADVSKRARQNLVSRLDSYQFHHREVFTGVISVIEEDVLPVVLRHALVGEARLLCSSPRHAEIFRKPLALDMVVDVMYDRGFSVCAEDRGGGVFYFKIYFAPPEFHNAAGTVDRGWASAKPPTALDAKIIIPASSADVEAKTF